MKDSLIISQHEYEDKSNYIREKLKFFNSKLSSKPLNTLAYRSVIVGNGLKEDPFISAFF